ncbi:MAG: hypothetical protein J5973_10085, partial [Eubacterium sp.]|nr:hypothetical protein [Eubacterium sp.]
MYSVVKRDGQIAPFDLTKISKALEKAFIATGQPYHPNVIDML